MRMFRIGMCGIAVTLGLALALAAGPALAKGPASDDSAAAKEHYKKGTKLYDLGKYDEAITEFEGAYELKDEPVLLYNIAQAYRLANKYAEALRFYRSYLRKFTAANKKDPPNKVEVETKIADMENLIAQQNRISTGPPVDAIGPGQHPTNNGGGTAPNVPTNANGGSTTGGTENGGTVASNEHPTEEHTTTETPPPPERAPAAAEAPKPGNTKLIAGIAIAAAGVACLGAGVGMGVLAMGKASDEEKAPQFNPDTESSGKTFQTVGLALDVAGGVLVVAGVVVAVLGVKQNQQAARTAQAQNHEVTFLPSVRPGFAGAALHLRF